MRRWIEELEEFAVDVIFARRGGKRAALLLGLLNGLSRVFTVVVRARLWLFRKRYLRNHHPGVLVISIGNLTVGGTGKTPVVEMFARELHRRGRRVAILSRGYKSKKPPLLRRLAAKFRKKPFTPRIVANEQHLLLDSRMAGDEPYMLAKNLPGVIVLVDKNRVASGMFAVKELGCDTLLLDDGMQFLHLRRRIEVCLIDRQAPFGNDFMLPRGTLREPPQHLRRATHIFITKSSSASDPALHKRIRKYNRTANIIECNHKPLYLENLETAERIPLEWLQGKYVGALCAIATPESFHHLLKKLGAIIEIEKHFADHHRFSDREIQSFLQRGHRRDVDAIITTEKDSVRFPRLIKPEVPVLFLRVEIELTAGHEHWEELMSRLCDPQPFIVPPKMF